MTSRSRNLSIIALVVLLLAGALAVIATKRTVLGLDLRGGVELVYEGQPTPQVPEVTPEAIDDAIETIRKRTDSLGVSEPEIQRAGANQISIGLPDVQNADRAVEQVGTTAKLQFYDWETNVLGDRGPEAPFAGSKALFQAVELASESKPKAERTDAAGQPEGTSLEEADRNNDTAKDKFYLFGPDQRLIAGPDANCEELLVDFESIRGPPRAAKDVPKGSECREQLEKIAVGTAGEDDDPDPPFRSGPPAGSQVLKVPQGIVVIEAERAPNQPESVQRYFVLEDDSELSGTDIKNPEQNVDQQTQEPIVTMEFTDKGREAFARVTKRIAQRGSEIILPPGPTATPRSSASRSRWTTASSRWRRSTSARTRRASTGAPARRSTASARSRRRRTSPRASASAPWRSTSS